MIQILKNDLVGLDPICLCGFCKKLSFSNKKEKLSVLDVTDENIRVKDLGYEGKDRFFLLYDTHFI